MYRAIAADYILNVLPEDVRTSEGRVRLQGLKILNTAGIDGRENTSKQLLIRTSVSDIRHHLDSGLREQYSSAFTTPNKTAMPNPAPPAPHTQVGTPD